MPITAPAGNIGRRLTNLLLDECRHELRPDLTGCVGGQSG